MARPGRLEGNRVLITGTAGGQGASGFTRCSVPGTALDTAPLALYLASDESSFRTGQVVSIDGGATAGWR